jgi:hypothetical protein
MKYSLSQISLPYFEYFDETSETEDLETRGFIK